MLKITSTEPSSGVRAYTHTMGKRALSFYTIDTDVGLVFVDAGLLGSVKAAFEQGLLKMKPMALIITHADADHIGDAAFLAERFPGFIVACHPKDRVWCEDHALMTRERYDCARQRGHKVGYSEDILIAMQEATGPDFKVTEELLPGVASHLLNDEWAILHLPGHSPGHLGLWNASTGVLLLGDALLGYGPPDQNGQSSMPPTHQFIGDYLSTIKLLKKLPVRLALSGHWPPLDEASFACLLKDSEACVKRDISQLLILLEVRPMSFDDLLKGLNEAFRTWDLSEDMHYIYALCGYLEYLLVSGEIRQEGEHFFKT